MTKQAPRTGPLAGTVIVDLTRVLAGPFATLLLNDLGAEIIKVEAPNGGDDARSFGPFVDGRSAYFMSLNRGKQSIALNLKEAEDRATFEALLARADVLVENYRGGTLERLGYDWDRLHRQFPSLIYAAVSGFGHTGPYKTRPAYDMVVQAMGGLMSLTGHPGGPPTRVGTSIGDLAAGLFTALAVVSALYDRERTGRATKVDVSMLDCQVALLENALARYFATGAVPQPLGARHPSIAPFEAYGTQDGHVVIAAGNDALFLTLCATLGLTDLDKDPRFDTNERRCANVEALKQAIEAALAKAPSAEWLERLEAAGVPAGPINTVPDVLADPQIVERNMIVETQDNDGVRLKMAGNPMKFSAHPDPTDRGPVPSLDGDRAAILDWLTGAPPKEG
ncbi:MAG: CaiB/BaiF CoA-transferase family protein [Pseudomonadota bacterium]